MSERILVLYRKQLGDLLILQPAIELLSRRYGLPVDVFCRPGMEDLLALMPGDVRRAPKWPGTYRAVFSFDPKPGATWYAALARSPEKHLLLTRRSFENRWHRLVYGEFAYYEKRDLYRGEIFHHLAGGDAGGVFNPARLNVPPPEWELGGLPDEYFVIHPTAAWRQKCWAPERWVEAIAPWRDTKNWIVTGGAAEWEIELATRLVDLLGPQAQNLAGRTTLKQYLALLSRASSVLCVDGSASHVAAAFSVPSLTLFGPSNPVQWHYARPNCIRLVASEHASDSSSSMNSLPVGVVRTAVKELLGGVPNA